MGPIKKSSVKMDRKRVGEEANIFISRVYIIENRKGTALMSRNPASRMLLNLFCPFRVKRNREKKIRRNAEIIFRIKIIFNGIFYSYTIRRQEYLPNYILYVKLGYLFLMRSFFFKKDFSINTDWVKNHWQGRKSQRKIIENGAVL